MSSAAFGQVTMDLAIHSEATAPVNNECSTPTFIATGSSVTYSVDKSTRTVDDWSLGNTDTWVEFTATGSSQKIKVSGLSGEYISGNCGSMSTVNNFTDAVSFTLSGLSSGNTYQVGIGHDATEAGSVTVELIDCSGLSVVASADPTGICQGLSSNLDAVPSGGASPYSYSWTPTTGLSDPNIADPVATPSTTTVYTVEVTDGNGCTASDAVTVTVNPSPTADAGSDVTICPSGSTQLGASGGTSYSWTPTTGLSDPNIADPVATPSSTTIYTVEVTDGNGCTDTDEVTVTVEDTEDPTITCPDDITVSTDAGLCSASGVNLGSPTTSDNCNVASVTNDGVEPYSSGNTTITWTVTDDADNTATCTQTVTVEDNEDPTITCPTDVTICEGENVNLGSPTTDDNCSVAGTTNDDDGNYPVGTKIITWTVTDDANNTATCEQQVIVNALPTAPTQSIDCSGGFGEAIVTVTSPTGAEYEYSLSGGAFQSSNVFEHLENGAYNITVRNVNTGCTTTGNSFSVNCGCTNGPTVSLSELSGQTCDQEPITIDGNTFGGSATMVSLSTDGSGTLSPLTSNSSPFTFSYTPSVADIGETIMITVTTDNPLGSPCVAASESYTLIVNASPTADAGSDETICFGASLELCAVEIADASYLWSTGDASRCITVNPTMTTSYLVTVSKNNCSSTDEVIVTVNPEITSSMGKTDETNIGMSDGTAWMVVTGGTAPYTFVWNTGATDSLITNLTPATYSVTMTDALGCTAEGSVVINAGGCGDIDVVSSSMNPLCFGECNGNISLDLITGGTAPYTYTWNTGDTMASITDLCVGNYTVTITDANNCQLIWDTTLVEPQELQIELMMDSTVVITGGTMPYDTMIYNEGNWRYAQVTDANYCEAMDSVMITAIADINPKLNIQVYPNPTSGKVQIDNGDNVSIELVRIYTPTGAVVLSTREIDHIDLSTQTEGLYLLQIITQKGSKVFQVLLIK